MTDPSSQGHAAAIASAVLLPDAAPEPPITGSTPVEFRFVRATERDEKPLEWENGVPQARTWLSEALNAKNVAFLLGAGCSSLSTPDGEGWKEEGIPTMLNLAKEFLSPIAGDISDASAEVAEVAEVAEKPPSSHSPTTAERKHLFARFGIDIAGSEFTGNLERLMELLHSLRFALSRSSRASEIQDLQVVKSLIDKVQTFLWLKCTRKELDQSDNAVLALYQKFYRKLVLRDRSLPRPWVFTTNYDLFNETAMDRLGLPYANGFSGVVERRFNPATFRYALAEQLDITNRKWSAVDGFVYLCKLHGSISWSEHDHGLFPIRESLPPGNKPGSVMIYPTPAKQNSSLGSPYSDLFREFQSRVVREQSILFTMGFAFGDEHINNIIYQALTIPTFRLVIFADPESASQPIKDLIALGDPRIWVIGGKAPTGSGKAHYFDNIVEHFMPELPNERISDAVEKVVRNLIMPAAEKTAADAAETHKTGEILQ